jgi:hypothetical protein
MHNLVKIWTYKVFECYNTCDMSKYCLYSISEEISISDINHIQFAQYSIYIYSYL